MNHCFLIKEAHVIDPGNEIEGINDVLIKNGFITQVEENIEMPSECYMYNAKGMIVTPGLIDLHVHGYEHATKLGINIDEKCLKNGVTTVADAGSAGAATFPGLKNFIMKRSNARLKAFLHIAKHGLASAGCASLQPGGECDSLNQLDLEECIECVKQYPDDIVGLKVRLSSSVCNEGKYEEEAYRRALAVSEAIKKPLMAHHAISTIPTSSQSNKLACPGSLRQGDVYTHVYHSYIIKNGNIDPAFLEARERGVLFDVGHGMGGFSWTNAEICAKSGFWPDIISTDLHTFSCNGPAYNLTTVMSKFLYLGMPLSKIIQSVTVTPARVMGLENHIGSLKPGMEADLTMLQVLNGDIEMEDCHNDTRQMSKFFKAIDVWRGGVKYACQ